VLTLVLTLNADFDIPVDSYTDYILLNLRQNYHLGQLERAEQAGQKKKIS
jgi:hypothetical protein